MAKLLKLRRGTDTQHTTFTGAEGEVTVNTTNDSLHVHDGTTAGGTELAKADLSNAAGASIPGTLTANRIIVDDDGAASPVFLVKTDDDGPWGFTLKNDTYSTDTGVGLKIFQSSTGGVTFENRGDSAYTSLYLNQHNGTTARNLLVGDSNGAVKLYYQSAKTLETTSSGIDVAGTVTCDGLTCDGDATINAATGIVTLKDSNNTGSGNINYVRGRDSANSTRWYVGHSNTGDEALRLYNIANGNLIFGTNDVARAYFQSDGHFVPATDDTYDLGQNGQQWRNAYFDGTVNCDGLSCVGDATIEASTGILSIKDNDSSGNATNCYVRGLNTNGAQRWVVGQISTGNEWIYLKNTANAGISFGVNDSDVLYLDETGVLRPAANNTYDLGASGAAWRNAYFAGDVTFSNDQRFPTVPMAYQSSNITMAAGHAGTVVDTNSNVTVPNNVFSVGNIVTIYNRNSSAAITISQASGLTMRLVGDGATGNRTLDAYGVATIWFRSGTECIISGIGVS